MLWRQAVVNLIFGKKMKRKSFRSHTRIDPYSRCSLWIKYMFILYYEKAWQKPGVFWGIRKSIWTQNDGLACVIICCCLFLQEEKNWNTVQFLSIYLNWQAKCLIEISTLLNSDDLKSKKYYHQLNIFHMYSWNIFDCWTKFTRWRITPS